MEKKKRVWKILHQEGGSTWVDFPHFFGKVAQNHVASVESSTLLFHFDPLPKDIYNDCVGDSVVVAHSPEGQSDSSVGEGERTGRVSRLMRGV